MMAISEPDSHESRVLKRMHELEARGWQFKTETTARGYRMHVRHQATGTREWTESESPWQALVDAVAVAAMHDEEAAKSG